MTTLGVQLAAAIAAKDEVALRAVVADELDFKGLTPGRLWEGASCDDLVAALGHWFEPQDHVDDLEQVLEGTPVADTSQVTYRLRLTTPDGPHLVEQQAYYRADDRGITYLRVLCSGFRPLG